MFQSIEQILAEGQSPYPLSVLCESEKRSLCKALWNWEARCPGCPDADGDDINLCQELYCPWKWRFPLLSAFFRFYQIETSNYRPEKIGDEYQALRTHQDVADVISFLRTNSAECTRERCMDKYFSLRSGGPSKVSQSDQERAFLLAARILTMVSVTNTHDLSGTIKLAMRRDGPVRALPESKWPLDRSLQMSIHDAFPPHGEAIDLSLINRNVTASNLIRIAKLKIRGTNNLHDHLRLNSKSGTVRVFHHTVFLKEHLASTLPKSSGGASSVTSPCLPRALLLETLITIRLLFPDDVEDHSQTILEHLIATEGFDPDCLNHGTATWEGEGEAAKAIQFPIWGARLHDLNQEIQKPSPRSKVATWMERHSRDRHMMMAILLTLIVTIVLGFLAFFLGVFQVVIAWLQYKNAPSQT